jgi:ParB family chromosome partitioning protein
LQVPTRIETAKRQIRFDTLPTDQIRFNPLNPRKIFKERELNELCDSIVEMGGILVPLVVFEVSPGDFVLLDGERRLRAARKLGLPKVPVNIIPGDLTDDVNLATMFNIHMARVPWNPAARALALHHLKGLYKEITEERLSEITGMKRREIRDAARILTFPTDIIGRSLQEGSPNYLKPANLVEMARAFEHIEEYLPGFFKSHKKEQVIRTYVRKIDERIIPRNTDFRLIEDMVSSLPPKEAEKLVARTITDDQAGIADVYTSVEAGIVSKRVALLKGECRRFISVLDQLDVKHMDEKSKRIANELLAKVLEIIESKIKR